MNVDFIKEKIDAYKEKAADFLQPVLQPGDEVEPVKWLNILLFFIALQFIYTLYQDVISLIHFGVFVSVSTFLNLLELVYLPGIFYLLLKRRRWGWILLFANRMFIFIGTLGACYIFFEFRRMHHGSLPVLLSTVLISAAFVYFLWRDDIVVFFGVTAKTKKETLAIAISGSLLLIVAAASL